MCSWLPRRLCRRKEFESLLGHLAHAAVVIRPGRLYLRQLFALLSSAPEPHHHIRLNLPVQADLVWWDFFLGHWNGVALFPPGEPLAHVHSNASGSFSCGAFDSDWAWFNTRWPLTWLEVDIAAKELVPLVIAAAMWGARWRGHHVLFHVDNIAVVTAVQSLNARDHLLCQLSISTLLILTFHLQPAMFRVFRMWRQMLFPIEMFHCSLLSFPRFPRQ